MKQVSLIYIGLYSQDIEHLGLASIAAFLRSKGIEVQLVHADISERLDVIWEKMNQNADFYGFSIYATNAKKVFAISDMLKEKRDNCIVFYGSQFASAAKGLIFDDNLSVDYIILGDGELPVYELVSHEEQGGGVLARPYILHRSSKSDGTEFNRDIKDMVIPSRDFIKECKENLYYTANIATSRGCYGNCSFCSSRIEKNVRWQGRDMKDVYDEIKMIYEEHGIRSFMFVDASFEDPVGYGKERISEFLEYILQDDIRYHFWCYLRADAFKPEDKKLVENMRKAGFTQVFVGIESYNESDLRLYNKRANLKANDEIMTLLRECDIGANIGFIMFNPYSTPEGLKDNYRYLLRNRNYYLGNYTSQIVVRYNTALHKKLYDKKLLSDDFSYLNEMGYCYVDSQVSECVEFINEYIERSPISLEERGFSSFDRYYFTCKALFPEEIQDYCAGYDSIQYNLAESMGQYFHHLFVEQNIDKSKEQFPDFEKEMMSIYSDYKKYRIKFYRKFLSYMKNY